MTDFGDTNFADKAGDKELQDFLMMEKQKAQFNAQVSDFCSNLEATYSRFRLSAYI